MSETSGDGTFLQGSGSSMTGHLAQVRELEEAVALARQHANDTDAGSLVRLAQALQNLAELQIELDQEEAAIALLQEEYQVGERIERLEPGAALLLDGRTSRLFAELYLIRGDHENAIVYGRDAEARLRQAVQKDRGVAPELAAALRALAYSLNAFCENPAVPYHDGMSMDELIDETIDRVTQGAAARAEAAGHGDVELQIALEDKHRAARKQDAQRKAGEALEIYRRFSKRQPELYLVAQALTTKILADILVARERDLAAAKTYEKAVDLYAKVLPLHESFQEGFLGAAEGAVEAYLLAGRAGKARKLSQRYGLDAGSRSSSADAELPP